MSNDVCSNQQLLPRDFGPQQPLAGPQDFKWPKHMTGYICQTPPFGPASQARLAQCCSEKPYNITNPTNKNYIAYPVTCGFLCQVDPAFAAPNENNPFGYSDFFKCVYDAGHDHKGDIVCIDGASPTPSSYSSTPSGDWMTKTWASDFNDPGLFPPFSSSVPHTKGGTTTQSQSLASSSSDSSTESTSSSEPSTTTGAAESSTTSDTVAPTSSSDADAISRKTPTLASLVLVLSTICLLW